MNKSTVRHILTALGAVLVFLGLGKFTGLTDILLANLDALWAAGSTLVGFALAVYGFFKNRTEGVQTEVLGLAIDKSLIRHILTGIGAILAFLGIGQFTGLIDLLLANLDGVWQAVQVIVGVAVAIYGYFKGRKD